jgi:mono/diheme cytochrome c family protein
MEVFTMNRLKILPMLLICILIILPVAAAACSGGTSTSPASASSAAAQTVTFQSLADSGQAIYSSKCASCHGASGQGGGGPALWGSGANLGTFNGGTIFNKNARDMLNFISSKMPLTAPGTLSHDQYLNVLGYILVQGNQVAGSTTFNESQLSTINLK